MRSKKIVLTSLATFALVGTLALSQTIFADTASNTSDNSTAVNSGKENSATTDANKPEKVVTQSIEWRIEVGKKNLKINGDRYYGLKEVD